MPRKSSQENAQRKLTKLGGGSFGVTIPIEFIRKLGWKERQKLVVLCEGRHLIVKDWRK